MWGVETFRAAIITDKTTKLKICIPMWVTIAQLQQQQNGTPCVTFSGIKKNVLIRLYSSSFVYSHLMNHLHLSGDSSTLMYTRLETSLHPFTFVCDSSTLV